MATRAVKKRSVWALFGGPVVLHAILIPLAIIFLVPYVWLFTRTFMPYSQMFAYPTIWIPSEPTLQHYIMVLTMPSWPFSRFLGNTLIVTAGVLVGRVLTASLVAYGFARVRFPGRDVLFILVLSTIMVPPQVTMIPTYILFKLLGWLGTFLPLIVPAFGGGGPFYIFLLRQFAMSVPLELDEAARIDGCGRLGIYWRIVLPLLKPALVAVVIFSFMDTWNDFLGPLLYLTSPKQHTLAIALRTFVEVGFMWPELSFAATVLVMLPPLLLFFFAQNLFVQGAALSGIKG
ncbi:MAG: carbohydrate ABC transporter permease [Candidatus Oleimicrobiaceae bacterium]